MTATATNLNPQAGAGIPSGAARLVIVTGGAGFIGSVLAALLSARGFRVGIVDVLTEDQRWRNLAGVPVAAYWHRDDFLAALRSGRAGRPEAIFHLGACSSTLATDMDFLLRNNYAYSQALAEWCLEHGVRLLYASSAATYGLGENGFSDDPAALSSLLPRNGYAWSKHVFDLWASNQGAFRGAGALVGFKYFNIYGPNEYHKGPMRSMVLNAFEQVQAGGPVRLFRSRRRGIGHGDQTRDFLYVAEAAAMSLWFLDHPGVSGIFNIGSGRARTWNDLAHAVFAACSRTPAIEYFDMPEQLRAGYQFSTCADLSRLRAAGCSLEPQALEAGVAAYVGYLQSSHRYFRAPEPARPARPAPPSTRSAVRRSGHA